MAEEGAGRQLKRLRKKGEENAAQKVSWEAIKAELSEEPLVSDVPANALGDASILGEEGFVAVNTDPDDAGLEFVDMPSIGSELESEPVETEIAGVGKKRKGKAENKEARKRKATKKEIEDIHAESQRLLRETKEVTFTAAPAVHVPLAGLLSKLRQRKVQLGWKMQGERIGSSTAGKDLDSEVMDEEEEQSTDETADAEDTGESEPSRSDMDPEDVGNSKSTGKWDDELNKPSEATQFCDSQSSFREDPLEEANGLVDERPELNLQVDQDGERSCSLNVEEDKSEKVQGFPTKPQVMALIDDEAEEEDEDLIRKESDDEEDDSGEMLEIIDQGEPEEPQDIDIRADLHRQWLEQQDEAQTDDILCRMQGNVKTNTGRVTSFLDADDAMHSPFETDKPEDDIADKKNEDTALESDDEEHDPERSNIGVRISVLLEEETIDMREASDDEETEREILKQQLLEAAESQERFMSPAEDESSRDLLGIIKKANVVSTAKHRPAQEKVGVGTALRTSKSTFLHRAASSSSFHKHTIYTATNSRSFIFGRDDSNSLQSLASAEAPGKENSAPKITDTSSQGLSLFSILKQHTSVSHQTHSGDKIGMADRLSIFAKFSKKCKQH